VVGPVNGSLGTTTGAGHTSTGPCRWGLWWRSTAPRRDAGDAAPRRDEPGVEGVRRLAGGRQGVLILRSWRPPPRLGEALVVNPYDVDGMGEALCPRSLHIPSSSGADYLVRERVFAGTSPLGARLPGRSLAPRVPCSGRSHLARGARRGAGADRLRALPVLLLDLDGTLSRSPPSRRCQARRTLISLLRSLSGLPRTSVHLDERGKRGPR